MNCIKALINKQKVNLLLIHNFYCFPIILLVSHSKPEKITIHCQFTIKVVEILSYNNFGP